MRISSDDGIPPNTVFITLTVAPQLAIDIATAILLTESQVSEPSSNLVGVGVALCDAVYETEYNLDECADSGWVVDASVPGITDTASLTVGEADPLPEAAEYRDDKQGATAEAASTARLVDDLVLNVEDDATTVAIRPEALTAYLDAQELADVQTSAIIAEAVEITKVAVQAAAEAKAATAEALHAANRLATAIAAEEVAVAASQTAADVQAQADTTATIAADAATDAAARLALTVTATAIAAASETAMAASTVSRAVAEAAAQAATVVAPGTNPTATALAAQTIAKRAARTASDVQSRAEAAASLTADAASDAATRLATTVSTTAITAAQETSLAALTVSRAVAAAAAAAAALASEAATILELDVHNAALAVQAIAESTALQSVAQTERRTALVALVHS